MKLSEVNRQEWALTAEELQKARDALDLLCDIANSKSNKEYEVVDADDDISLSPSFPTAGYPTLSILKVASQFRGVRTHYLIWRASTDELQLVNTGFPQQIDAFKLFLKLLDEAGNEAP